MSVVDGPVDRKVLHDLLGAFGGDHGPEATLSDLESWIRERLGSSGAAGAELKLLLAVSTMYLEPSSSEAPLKPRFSGPQGRSAVPDDFSEDEVEALMESLASAKQASLQARIGDIAWTRCRKYDGALAAIDAYLMQGKKLVPLPDPEGMEALERGCKLAASLGANHTKREDAKALTADLVSRAPSAASGTRVHLLELALMFDLDDPAGIATLAENEARLAEADSKFILARGYWTAAAQWHRRAQDEAAANAASLKAAETYMLEAKPHIDAGDRGALVAALFISDAIAALRAVPNTHERREELHRQLTRIQESAPSTLGVVKSGPIDLATPIEAARAAIAGKAFRDGLFALAFIHPWPSAASLREQATRHTQQNFLSSIFSPLTINDAGKVIAKTPSSHSGDTSEVEAALLHQMYRSMLYEVQMVVHGAIQPARDQLLQEHSALFSHVVEIVQESPLIPPGRELQFAQGVHAGLHGDFLVAAHLLIPQLEHAIRHLFCSQGAISSGLTQDRLQLEYDLNRTLYMDQAEAILSQDLTVALRGLLVEQVGANLRNKLAHGLSGAAELYGYPSVYTWWLVLGMCLFPLAHAAGSDRKGADSGEAPEHEEPASAEPELRAQKPSASV